MAGKNNRVTTGAERGRAPLSGHDINWRLPSLSTISAEQRIKEEAANDKTTVVMMPDPLRPYFSREPAYLPVLQQRALQEARLALATLYPDQSKEKNVVIISGSEITMVSGAEVSDNGEIKISREEKEKAVPPLWYGGARRNGIFGVVGSKVRETEEVAGVAHISRIILPERQSQGHFEPDNYRVTVVDGNRKGVKFPIEADNLGPTIEAAVRDALTVTYDVHKYGEKGDKKFFVMTVGKPRSTDGLKVANTEKALALDINGRLGDPQILVLGDTDYVAVGAERDPHKFNLGITKEAQLSGLLLRVQPLDSGRGKGPEVDHSPRVAAANGRTRHVEAEVEAPVVESAVALTVATESLAERIRNLTLRQVAGILGNDEIQIRGLEVTVGKVTKRNGGLNAGGDEDRVITRVWHNQSIMTHDIMNSTPATAQELRATLLKEADPTNLVLALEQNGTRQVKKREAVNDVASANTRVVEIRQAIGRLIHDARGARTINEIATDYLNQEYRGADVEYLSALAEIIAPKTAAEKAHSALQHLTQVNGDPREEVRQQTLDLLRGIGGIDDELAEMLVDRVHDAYEEREERRRGRGGERRTRRERRPFYEGLTADEARELLTVPDPTSSTGTRLFDRSFGRRMLISAGFSIREVDQALAELDAVSDSAPDLAGFSSFGVSREMAGRRFPSKVIDVPQKSK